MNPARLLAVLAPILLVLVVHPGCDNGGSGDGGSGIGRDGGDKGDGGDEADGGGTSTDAGCGPDTSNPDETLPDTIDPEQGMFTMEEALHGLPEGPGPLRAIIDTDLGTLTCTLRDDMTPNAVANFIGLARGTRPWKDPTTKKWVKRRFYDGLRFHRVIPMFVAQGGDPLGTGFGGPGYRFDDEISDLTHVPGALAYANSGPNNNGSQFYVAEEALPNLDGNYTVFGLCDPVSVVSALTHVMTDSNDKPLTDLHMKTITITRCAPSP